jgi:protein-L-isoaspartate(D-aspartate) O-methyltransferase
VNFDRVADAFAAVPRERFLPAGQRRFAHLDRPLPIGHGQTNSQPTTVRQMLELLDVQPGDRVLDVGSGSGWTTVLLAWLTGAQGSVVGVERVPDLVAFGSANVRAAGMPWAHVREAVPGRFGAPSQAPFERILVSAQAPELPLDLVSQLAPAGVLVVPVAGRMLRVTASTDDTGGPAVEEHGWSRFVPLVADPPDEPQVD